MQLQFEAQVQVLYSHMVPINNLRQEGCSIARIPEY